MIYSLIVLAASEMLLIFATIFPSKKRLRPQARLYVWAGEEKKGREHSQLKELGVRRSILLLLRV